MIKTKKKTRIFFVGGRERGLIWLKEATAKKEMICGALILKEDDHEKETFSKTIIKLLKKHSIKYLLTKSAKNEKYLKFIQKSKPSLIIVMGWRTLLPESILNIPELGVIAVHESLLPKYRGFAPVNWVIINGETKTGVTLFYLSNGIDNGDIIAQKKILISKSETAATLYKKTTAASLSLLSKYLPHIKEGNVVRKKQNESLATYTCSRTPEDGEIDWSNKTTDIINLVKALSYPYTGAFTYLKGKKIILEKCSIPNQKKYVGSIPGKVIRVENQGVQVLTGDGIIQIESLLINNKVVPAKTLINSIRVTLG